jgi:hypothetical protein
MFNKIPFDPRSVQYGAHSRFDPPLLAIENTATDAAAGGGGGGTFISGYALTMSRPQSRGLSHVVQRRVLLPARGHVTIPEPASEKPLNTVQQSAIGPGKENDAETLLVKGSESVISIPVGLKAKNSRKGSGSRKKRGRKVDRKDARPIPKRRGGRGTTIKGAKRRLPPPSFSSFLPNTQTHQRSRRNRVDTFGPY